MSCFWNGIPLGLLKDLERINSDRLKIFKIEIWVQDSSLRAE